MTCAEEEEVDHRIAALIMRMKASKPKDKQISEKKFAHDIVQQITSML